jgi:hypothetical protein
MLEHFRVFISSTYSDLREYREAVALTLRRFGLVPIRLEDFDAEDQPPLDVALHSIDSSDIVIVLVAYRYGYVPFGGNKSLVELEYERGREAGKPILCFLLDDNQPWPPGQVDPDADSIKAFRGRLLRDREQLVAFFTTPDDLAAKVAVAVSQYSRHVEGIPVTPPPPPTRESPLVSLADVVSELKAMRAEFSVLQQSVADALRRPITATTDSGDIPKRNSADFLGPPALSVDPNRCFVIMPYSQKWSRAVERIILEVCGEVGLEFQIAKDMESRFIPHDIWRGITGSGVIVADLSAENPNVAYEVGLADVTGKEVILIAQQANVPFDFSAQRVIFYENSVAGSLTLREELKSKLQRYKAKWESS